MAKKRFSIHLEADVNIDVEESVLAVGKDHSWQKAFYGEMTECEVAQHIAYNAIINGRKLSQIDGFADQPDDAIKVEEPDWNYWTN